MPEASTTKNEREVYPYMSLIKEFFEDEIHANYVNNPNPIPNGTQLGAPDNPDFASYFKLMDEEIESLVKAAGRG